MYSKELLLKTVILGTEQQEIPDLESAGLLGQSLQGLKGAGAGLGRERTLLHAASLVCLAEKAGRQLAKFTAAFCLPCPPEEKNPVPQAAARVLKQLLEDRPDLLREWLLIAASMQGRVPDESLPAILQIASQNKALRPLIRPCLGTRGYWLSQLNPDWRNVGLPDKDGTDTPAADFENVFETGRIDERCAALREIRRAHPSRGIELLRATWGTERPEDRTRLLAATEVGLSMADEPFLEEEALDDRRKEVRMQARELLLKLPDSRLSLRAEQRAFQCLVPIEPEKGGFLANLLSQKKRGLFTVAPPEEYDSKMLRDGIAAKSTDYRVGEKAWWLSQIVEMVNPRRLMKHLNVTAQQLVDGINSSDWQYALRQGIERAAIRCADSELAVLFLQCKSENAGGLFDLLDSSSQESVMAGLFAPDRPVDYNTEFSLLLRMQHLWSPAFSRVMLRALRAQLTQRSDYMMETMARYAGIYMDTDLWRSVEETWLPVVDREPALKKMAATLALRKEMKNAMNVSPGRSGSS